MGRHNDKNIKEVLQDFLAKNKKVASGYHSVRIAELWKEVMGPVINNYTKQIELKNGILKIVVTSAPLRRELVFGKQNIREQLNQALGKDLIEDVVVL
jgi:hypothetical protein